MDDKKYRIENKTKDVKLHTARAIGGATFLGGPLAAGYLIRENFNALGKRSEGQLSLIIGIVATILLFSGIFITPNSIMDKIPRQIIPLIYTGIIYGIVEWKQGDALKAHQNNGQLFFSGWRSAGVGLVALLIISAGIFTYAYLESNNPVYTIYDEKIAEFSKNEMESLTFYDNIAIMGESDLLKELNYNVLPKWDKNIELIQELNSLEGLPSDLLTQNEKLLSYSKLRLEVFQLLKKSIIENTNKYDSQIQFLNLQIENKLDELN
ncbi:hypothetical protein [uncultured Psychroserpens sp.]|uniref:hypothetical protein n=1 Tax=uncultured Psychroserpens sp. TaxID=255436 RepID=UPI00262A55B6|nr:hypothetical protein [uncultured Psychroserpens sp.]